MRYLKNYSDLKINLIDTITIFQRNPLKIIKASIILILALIKSFFIIKKNQTLFWVWVDTLLFQFVLLESYLKLSYFI